MIDVKSRRCQSAGCTTQPSFNLPNESQGLYCSKHKQDGMIDIKNHRCQSAGCITQPAFNLPGETKGLYCSKHKQVGMIDVRSRRCKEAGCTTQPTFNLPSESQGLYCAEHKQVGMIDVKSRRCQSAGCTTQPTFNNRGQAKGLYCAEHKQDGMIDVINPSCKSDWCDIRANKKYDNYCLFCYIKLFPNEPIARNYKTKEKAVVDFITLKYPTQTWISDKKVQDGCSKRRPDLLLDLGYQIIIVEVDENQHIDYDCSCENKRIMELSLDLDHRPIIFIRFNPDDYVYNEQNIASCWGYDKLGISRIKRNKVHEWSDRLNTLSETIDYWCNPNNITEKTVEVIELFYDTNLNN
jgi:hypothetical protein